MGRFGREASSIGWGLVGAGAIAEHFAADLEYVTGAHLAAVTSRAFEKASGFAARHDAVAHADLASLLGDRTVDAVYVASPNDTHFSTTMAAIAAGKGVLVEKPLATTLADAERLSAAAIERNIFLMEGMWTRFLPAITFVREALRSAAIGKIRHVDGELAFFHRYDPDSRFFDAAKGGGALLDLGVYLISLSLALLGRPDTVDGDWRATPSGVDMAADIELTFGEARARLRCALDREGANLFVIEGTRGTLILQPPFIATRQVIDASGAAGRLLARLPNRPAIRRAVAKLTRTLPLPSVRRHGFDFPGYGLQFEIDAATRAISEGRTIVPHAPMEDTIETLRIVESIRDRRRLSLS